MIVIVTLFTLIYRRGRGISMKACGKQAIGYRPGMEGARL
jgi:hypothetical protein